MHRRAALDRKATLQRMRGAILALMLGAGLAAGAASPAAAQLPITPPPEEEGEGAAAERLAHTLDVLQEEGIDAMGQVAHPDPFTAIQNALHFFGIDEIVISTFPEARSGWMRADLIERVRQSTDKPVHHVVAEDSEEATA